MTNKEEAKKEIQRLLEKFDKSDKSMNEETAKKNFILPLFRCLGWDVESDDVSAEEKISKKRVDYGFKMNGITKFFLEAKKPSEDVLGDIDHIRQAINYSYWKSVTWAVLTNFRDLVVFNAEWKSTNLSENRFITLNYREFVEKFDKLWLLSTESFAKNTIDEEAVVVGKKQKREPVGETVLGDLINWRELLTKNINKYDHNLDQENLDEAVQRILDRLIFIKSCEDRGIESAVLLPKARQWEENWQTAKKGLKEELISVFRYFDSKYNSKLFESHPCESLRIDDDIINRIIKELNGDESGLLKYDFSAIPADILGSIYEQYLGHILQKSQKSAKVIEKHAHRKQQGIYYTPTYIVDYIVKNTVSEYAKGKTLDEVLDMKILDPACGSGSFLIRAYSEMLRIIEERMKKGEKSTKWVSLKHYSDRLNINQKIAVLTSCIHGVDLDTKAVEIAQLNLLLKLLEGETQESLKNIKEVKKILPMLNNNIKCGNSLIDNDTSKKAFVWEAEFKEILQNGGFDVIVGNPPYIRIQTLQNISQQEVEFLKRKYTTAVSGNYDIYVVFVERGFGLLKKDGVLGFILPHKFFNAQYGEPLRKLLSDKKSISKIVHFGDQQVFEGATTYTCLLFLKKSQNDDFTFSKVANLKKWSTTHQCNSGLISSKIATEKEWNFTIGQNSNIYEKLNNHKTKLGDIANIFVGLQTSADTVFLFKKYSIQNKKAVVYSKELDKEVEIETDLLKPVIRSGSIGRYWALPTALVLFPYHLGEKGAILIPQEEMKQKYPKTWEYLNLNKKLLSGREHGKFKGDEWYQLYPKNLELWERPKILVPYMVTKLSGYTDYENLYFVNVTTGGFGITIEPKYGSLEYFTGLINSDLLNWFMKNVSTTFHGGYFAANKQFLVQLPIKVFDISNKDNKILHDKIVLLVKNITHFYKELGKIDDKTDAHQKLMNKINSATEEINDIVYDIYGITKQERKTVEDSLK